MREYIDGIALRDMVLCAYDALEANRQHINELNVFPVPDGDTGTNMSLTMSAAVTELNKKQPSSVDSVAEVTASALLRGARGNSGVILPAVSGHGKEPERQNKRRRPGPGSGHDRGG